MQIFELVLLKHSPDCEKGLHAQFHEPTERRSFHFAAHHENHLVSELDIWFKAQISARRTLEHEAKINVYDVALSVYHDIAIVTIFYL